MGAFSLGIKSRLGFGRVVAALHAIYAVSEPRLSAVVAKGASELASVTGAGLVGAGHSKKRWQIPTLRWHKQCYKCQQENFEIRLLACHN